MAEVLTEEVPEWKEVEIEKFRELISQYDAVGVVNVEGIASKQFQEIRRNLHGSAKVRVGRNTLMRFALELEELEELEEYVDGQSGLILTDDNPFKMYRELQEGKSPAPIKAGQEAPDQVVVPEGDTGFEPGPFVGDLQQIGANARIEDGSIKVVEDSVVLEEGEEADDKMSEILGKLEIYPIEVGLELKALKREGTVFEPDTLDIDFDEYRTDLEAAAAGAFNLGVNAGVANDKTVEPMLSKAFGEALGVGVEATVAEPKVLENLVSEADAAIKSLAAELDDDVLPDELQDVEVETQQEPEEEHETDEEEEEEEQEADEDDGDDEEDVSEGMGNLF
ncbi:MAG: 50S ribosomal protein L10 [Halobacteria archaeon]